MSVSLRNRFHLLAAWLLVLLALLVRLSSGSIALPSSVFDDPVRQLTKLSILCDEPAPLSDPDGKHQQTGDDQDGSLLLADLLELLPLIAGACLPASLSVLCIHRVWTFPPVRGPPLRKRSSLCPQGPPA
ncbi:hypothetical protein GOB93_10550 [Acetobacter musti]|uniref:Secreted protein n=1 Tax=Acetobacter musti TaxID=864732 RepID=A0ABX0JQJ6_9PROT|nr:hypothetical protein [Acetobacter musti]NHN85077.1 hypothetical protein [Acetobacter musti]